MNSPGLKFVDDFTTAELSPFIDIFISGAAIAYGHAMLSRHSGFGYTSEWANKHFPQRKDKNNFFFELGETLPATAYKLLSNITTKNTPSEILNIIKEINPEGLLIKSDLTSSELAEAFQHILFSPPYYSSTVNTFLNTTITSDVYLDETNRKILHLLSQGVKTKTLKEHIDLSMSAIEKRKKHLKLLFDVEDGKDETLLKEARIKGFL